MNIVVTYGIGDGLTRLAAFDAALLDAGIGDYNLIKLSSVVPPGSVVTVGRPQMNGIERGYKLFVVLACGEEDRAGMSAYAGLGWRYSRNEGGIFAECHAAGENDVIEYIRNTFGSVKRCLPSKAETGYKVVGARCIDRPVCAVVAAIYKSESWC